MWRTLGRFFRGYKGFYRWIFLSHVLLFATCTAIRLVPFQTHTLSYIPMPFRREGEQTVGSDKPPTGRRSSA